VALRKPKTPVKNPLDSLPPWVDQEFAQEFPNLHAFLFDDAYEDGKPRLRGTMNVSVRNGVLSIALNDNDNQRTLWINMGTWAEAIFMANQSVCNDNADWKAKSALGPVQKTPF